MKTIEVVYLRCIKCNCEVWSGEKKEINETFKGQKQEEIKGVCECGSQKFAIRKT